MKVFFNNLHYNEKPNIFEKTLVALLSPASFAYSVTSEIRMLLYNIGVLKSYKPSALTVAVGNLTTGGTGKTPITAAIANHLTTEGYKTAILSRGYGSKLNSKDINIISDGQEIFYTDGKIAGDEPLWLAQNCPNCAVLTSSNRVQIAKFAEQKLGCTALILDDGFQHIKLKRDINICVTDSKKLFGNKKVLPAGPLRESIKNLKRADRIIIVSKGDDENIPFAENKLKQLTEKEIFVCKMEPEKVYEMNTNSLAPKGSNAIAFCAIGQPEQFYNFLKKDYNLVKTVDFEDHHCYTEEDINKLSKTAEDANAILITTEKDGAKLKKLTDKDIYLLKISPVFDVGKLLKR